jgi:tetratricopeptide (TPR) repeat protein
MSPTRFLCLMLLAMCSATFVGCFPSSQSPQDEEKEPHFLAGRSRVNARDYNGAIEAFNRALETNPHSAAAHFELGWLYAEKDGDPAAAIYHYQQYLRLRPKAENADTIKDIILRLKQELAKGVLPMPSSPAMQKELDQLAEDNRRLREELEKWRAYAAARGAVTNSPIGSQPEPRPAQNNAAVKPPPSDNASRAVTTVAKTTRTHKVQPGDTPSSIARKYNVKLDALLAANPSLNPKRLQVGQLLNIPAL